MIFFFLQYACRKTLADSRPRVRGRFAKNDELGEARRPNSTHHEYEDDEEVSSMVWSNFFLPEVIHCIITRILGIFLLSAMHTKDHNKMEPS